MQLGKDERVLKVVRKHWFVLLTKVFGVVILFLIPFYVIGSFANIPIELGSLIVTASTGNLAFFLGIWWSLMMWMYLFGIWTDYYLDEWIITTERVIDIDQRGFFNREIQIFPIENIEELYVHVDGFIPTLLNFGEVHVQTAGPSDDKIMIRGVGNPQGIRDMLMTQYRKIRP